VLEEDKGPFLATYASLVNFYARGLAKSLLSGLDEDDLVQVGNIALLECADRYDPSRKASFRTFAGWRVHGAMIDEIRRMHWVPRHEGVTHLLKVIATRTAQHLPITSESLAEATGQSVEKVRSWERRIAFASARHVSLSEVHESLFEDGWASNPVHQVADESPNALALIEERERYCYLHGAVDQLPDRVRTALSLYYFEGLTMIQIAAHMSVTESRVSQLIAKGKHLLKEILAGKTTPIVPALQTCAWCGRIFVRGKITRDFCRAPCKQAALGKKGTA